MVWGAQRHSRDARIVVPAASGHSRVAMGVGALTTGQLALGGRGKREKSADHRAAVQAPACAAGQRTREVAPRGGGRAGDKGGPFAPGGEPREAGPAGRPRSHPQLHACPACTRNCMHALPTHSTACMPCPHLRLHIEVHVLPVLVPRVGPPQGPQLPEVGVCRCKLLLGCRLRPEVGSRWGGCCCILLAA